MTYTTAFESHMGMSFVDALPLSRDCLEQLILKLDADRKARTYVTSFLAGLGTLQELTGLGRPDTSFHERLVCRLENVKPASRRNLIACFPLEKVWTEVQQAHDTTNCQQLGTNDLAQLLLGAV